jgi:hypothetical protein
MSVEKLYTELFELIGYKLTSVRGLIDEPQLYGPFRLIDGVSRLCGYLEDRPTGYGGFFEELKGSIDEKKFVLMTDEGAFVKLLDEAVLLFTRKVKEGSQH